MTAWETTAQPAMVDATAVRRHRLGFAVKAAGAPQLKSHDMRRWASEPSLAVSIACLQAMVAHLVAIDIRCYRIADSFVPYGTHPDHPRFHGQVDAHSGELARVGALLRDAGIRLTNHPGQYTVLNSERREVRESAARDLSLHAALFDAMGLGAESVVVLHVGSAGGGLAAARERFLRAVDALPSHARARLVIENDDRTWCLADVLEIAADTGLRVVFDNLHHFCHDPHGIPEREGVAAALATWPAGETPKVHFSSPRLSVEPATRATPLPALPTLPSHADLVDPLAFLPFMRGSLAHARDVDIMIEAKAKARAAVQLRDQIVQRGMTWRDGAFELPA